MPHRKHITTVTFQAPQGPSIRLTNSQIQSLRRAGVWLRCAQGEFATVSRGQTRGAHPTLTVDEVDILIREGSLRGLRTVPLSRR